MLAGSSQSTTLTDIDCEMNDIPLVLNNESSPPIHFPSIPIQDHGLNYGDEGDSRVDDE